MLVGFDKFGLPEKPVLTLAYPHRKELGQLGSYVNFACDPVLQSYSTISFQYPYKTKENQISNLYDKIENQMVIKAEGLGEYIIANCEEENDGTKRYKNVTANSAEYQLCKRKINLLNGTYTLKKLLEELFAPLPSWKIGEISTDLEGKHRTFDVPDSTLYDFLINDVAKTYECVFVFDTINRKINAYTVDDVIKESDIYVSYSNFLKSEKIEEISDELVTVMSCYGGDGVNIASVNPTGTVSLYNFDYYMPMMSESLREHLSTWKAKYDEYTVPCKYEEDKYIEGTGGLYSNLLRRLKEKNSELIELQGDLTDLDMKRKALEDVQAVKIAGGRVSEDFTNNIIFNGAGDKVMNEEEISYSKIVEELKTVNENIVVIETDIATVKSDIAKLKDNQNDPNNKGMKQINEELAFKAGDIFSKEDLEELDYFKFESTHQDDNYIVTDAMNLTEEQDMIQQFYDSCVNLMKTVSQPTYNITADTVNFLFIEKIAPYINKVYNPEKSETLKQLLGVRFHLEISEDNWIDPVLLKFHVNFDDPTDFSMEFSNKYRLNSAIWTYGDLFGESVSATGSMSFDYSSVKNWTAHKNEMLDFINSNFDVSRNRLVNSSENNSFLIDNTGIRGSSKNKDGTDSQKGIWITADTLAFTDDDWQTVKTALGLIGNTGTYGLNAEMLIGKTILSTNMKIGTEKNTITIDDNGINLVSNNSTISLKVTDELDEDGNTIAHSGISIYNNNKDRVFYTDTDGNVVLTGNITATSGRIAGFSISEENINNIKVPVIKSDDGNIVLRSNGTAKIGDLIMSAGKADFNGTIYADQIVAKKSGDTKSHYLDPNVIKSGSITGGEYGMISSGTITAGEIKSGTITTSELKMTGTNGIKTYFDGIYAASAEIGSLVATALQANDVVLGKQEEYVSGTFTCWPPANFKSSILYKGYTMYTAKTLPSNGYYLYVTKDISNPDTSLTEL